MRKQWNLLVALVLVLLIVLFSIANVDNVTVSFLFGHVRLPKVVFVIGSFLLGALLVGLFTYAKIYRQQRQIRQLQRELDSADRSRVGAETDAETRTGRRARKK
ncbi:MAG: LapA family protein [Sporolactobacillus sp.]